MTDPKAIGTELTGGTRFRGAIRRIPAHGFRAAIKTSFSEQIIRRWHSVTRRSFNPVPRNLRRPPRLPELRWPPPGEAQFHAARFYNVLASVQLNLILGPINRMFRDPRIDAGAPLTQGTNAQNHYGPWRSAGSLLMQVTNAQNQYGPWRSALSLLMQTSGARNHSWPWRSAVSLLMQMTGTRDFWRSWRSAGEPPQPKGAAFRWVSGANSSGQLLEFSRMVKNAAMPRVVPPALTNIFEFRQRLHESLEVIASLAAARAQAGNMQTHTCAVAIRPLLDSLVHASTAVRLADKTCRSWQRLQPLGVFPKTMSARDHTANRSVHFDGGRSTNAWHAQRSRARTTGELSDVTHSTLKLVPWRGLTLSSWLTVSFEAGDNARAPGIGGKQLISWQRPPQLSLVTGPSGAATALLEAALKNEGHLPRWSAFGDSANVYHARGESKLLQELVKEVRDLRRQPEVKPAPPYVLPEISQITRQVCDQLEREIKIQKERRGL